MLLLGVFLYLLEACGTYRVASYETDYRSSFLHIVQDCFQNFLIHENIKDHNVPKSFLVAGH